ncbi:MAG: CRISPR-associated endonuclease Cas1 [Pseudomonadota bacterium]
MATLYIDRPELELRHESNALIIYEAGQRRSAVPTKLIERVIIQRATRLDTGLLLKLAEAGASVLLLSPRHSRRVAILLGAAHNEAAIRLAQAQRVSQPQYVQPFARELVLGKLHRQIHVLEHALSERPDARKDLFDGLQSLRDIQSRLQQGEAPALSVLRGHEGAAARSYFQAYAALLPPALGFAGRNRRPPRDPVNACLSLAYTLLHFDAVRAAHAAGLDPLLGFYHQPAFGRESLASDLIEPLRPHADAWVWRQFRERNLRAEHFSDDKGACLLSKTGRERFYPSWEQHARAHRRWLRTQTGVLARQLRTEGLPLLADAEDDLIDDV